MQVHFFGFTVLTVRFPGTISAVVNNNTFYVCLVRHMSFQQYNNTESRTKMLLWRICVAANNESPVGLHVKWTMFLFAFKQIFIFLTDFQKIPNIKFHRNLSIGSRANICQLKSGQTEGQKYMRFFGIKRWLLKTHWIPMGPICNLGSWYNISVIIYYVLITNLMH